MKEPDNFELKKWLANHIVIVKLEIHHFMTGTDTSSTDWEMTASDGATLRVRDSLLQPLCGNPLVKVALDWVAVLRTTPEVIKEVREYEAFLQREAADLAEYNRLKEKFEK